MKLKYFFQRFKLKIKKEFPSLHKYLVCKKILIIVFNSYNNELNKKYEVGYLLTRRLTQDCIDYLFPF